METELGPGASLEVLVLPALEQPTPQRLAVQVLSDPEVPACRARLCGIYLGRPPQCALHFRGPHIEQVRNDNTWPLSLSLRLVNENILYCVRSYGAM